MLVKVFLLTLAVAAAKCYEVQEDLEGFLHSLERSLQGVDFLQYAHVDGREARVVVLKDSQVIFESLLKLYGIPFEVYIKDVKALAESEMKVNEEARMAAKLRSNSKIGFVAYHRHSEINAYLDDLAVQYPNRVTVRNVGYTSEGRLMKVIIISTSGGTDPSKPVFIADAGIHAREWVAPSQALYMIKKLVEDVTESDLVNNMDWVIFPLLNPDGYEFSHTDRRLWRKTRSTASSSSCPGVDGNRNFDYKWMVSGSSTSTCSDQYAGPHAFSEPETRYLRDVVFEFQGRAKVYMAIHSHGSYFIYPYGYNGLPTPDNEEIHKVGLMVAEAIDKASLPGSRKYLVGNSGSALKYLASGATDDYAYAVGNIKLSYTLELPGNPGGFELPPSRIQQVVKETWEGIVVLARYAIQQNQMN